jgi:alpha-beta hydrolase superfamily lysophospholipase
MDCPQACDYGSLKEFLASVQSKDITLLTLQDARHELLKCPERAEVLSGMISWLTRQAAAP